MIYGLQGSGKDLRHYLAQIMRTAPFAVDSIMRSVTNRLHRRTDHSGRNLNFSAGLSVILCHRVSAK